jgi:hypothetical protein
MTENDFNVFLNCLRFERLTCNVVFNRDASIYIKGFDRNKDDTLRHRRLHIMANLKFVVEELRRLPFQFDIKAYVDKLKEDAPGPIQVDIITSKKHYDTPFMTDLDFQCNGLYISKHGLSIAKELVEDTGEFAKFRQMSKIIDDIINRVAVYCHPINTSNNIGVRVQKMIDCGWTIQDSQGCIISISDENYDGHCIICHEDVPNIHFKMTCCDARYHASCMRKTLECSYHNGQCIMCKKIMPFLNTHARMLD